MERPEVGCREKNAESELTWDARPWGACVVALVS